MRGTQQFRKTASCVCILYIAPVYLTAQITGSAVREDPATGAPESPQTEFLRKSQAEKWHNYLKNAFGLGGVLRSFAGAGISQWQNTPGEWGQGTEGYARRVANSYAQHVMRSTMLYGASSVLHEDNRYRPSGLYAFTPRLKYAIASSFLARRDDGTRHVSISRLSSYLATAFISREWQPPSMRGTENAVLSFGTAMGATVGFNVAREFLPKALRRFKD